jgi:hypothetical protein
MGAHGRINNWTLASFLNSLECIRLSSFVLREEDTSRDAVLETHHAMFPITNMVAEANVEDGLTKVVRVEEEPEGIDNAGPLINHYENSRSGRVPIGIGLMPIGFLSTTVLRFAIPRIRNLVYWAILANIVPGGRLSGLGSSSRVSHGRTTVMVAVFVVREWLGSVVMAM